jgi:hypothetical protein
MKQRMLYAVYGGRIMEVLTSCLGLILLGAVERRGAVGWDAISCSILEHRDDDLCLAFSFTWLLNTTDLLLDEGKRFWSVENN